MLLLLRRIKTLPKVIRVMIFQMYENLVSQIHDLIHTVRVLIFLNPEGNRNGAPSWEAPFAACAGADRISRRPV